MLSTYISANILPSSGAIATACPNTRIETRALPSTSRPNLFSGD